MKRHTDGDTCEFRRISFSTRPDGLPLDWDTFKSRKWAGIRAQYRRLSGPQLYEFEISSGGHCFALLDLYREDGQTVVGGMTKNSSKDLRNKFIYADPSSVINGWSQLQKPASFVLVELESAEQDGIADIAPIFMRADTMIKSVLLQFKTFLIDESFPMTSYAETLGAMLRHELIRIEAGRHVRQSGEFGLTARQLKAAIAYMDDRIDQDISVADMARELGMSAFHFIRMFKKSAGLPPHKFFIARRIERAKELLRSQHLSISEIAEMSGFNGATQLTRAFRRIVGTNPSTFRREML